MTNRNALREAILTRLSTVIDPETGADVVRMRLIEDLAVDEGGVVRYTFRPSSPLCPIAISLALSIREAVAEVEGVTGQEIEVAGYVRAEELNTMLRGLPEMKGSQRAE
jgi:metal-sulfur cluster biosynthetic enzyme